MVRILGSTGSRRRRTWLALGTAAALTLVAIPATSFADSSTGCDFVTFNKNGTTTDLCIAALTPSNFAGADGNLLTSPPTYGTSDWQNVGINCTSTPPVGCGIDQATGGSDNSFGQGTKEDDPAVSVVSGSIPPNKSDLTRFYQASENIGSGSSAQTFLYLAWERTNVLGNANMDFEINQAQTCVGTTTPGTGGCATGHPFSGTDTGKITLNRTAGDMLITFDFVNGGGRPVLGLNRWLTSTSVPSHGTTGTVVPYWTATDNACLSANSFPCWGDHITLTSAVAIGAVNNLDSVTDPIAPSSANACPGTPATCAASTFGETAINLTGAGVFSPGVCESFATTDLSSRSSASFTAEKKDFVAPIPTRISNCGEIKIIKRTDPRAISQDFPFTSDVTGTTTADPTSSACPTTSYTLNDSAGVDGAANTNDCFNVPAASYTVSEGTVPTGFAFESLTCTPSGTGTSVSTTGQTANITLAPNGLVTCIYVNQQQLGAIKVTKIAKNANCSGSSPPDGCSGGNAPLAGAGFEIWKESNGVTGLQTTASGSTLADTKIANEQLTVLSGSGASTEASTCFDGLGFNDATHPYYVHESSPPTGYNGGADQTVVISANSTCAGSPVTKSVTDTPLSQIRVTFHSLGGSGVTTATIECTGGLPGGDDTTFTSLPDNSTGRLLDNLPPNTSPGYTCTVKIDP